MEGRRLVSALLAVASLLAAATPALAQGGRERFDVRVFARVGSPGQPEGIAIGPDGKVYVSTHQNGRGDAAAPSKIFVYSPDGRLERDFTVEGQALDRNHGVMGIAFDGNGVLYGVDRAPPRIFTLDPATGRQGEYVRFRDVPPCAEVGRTTDCSATQGDFPTVPDYLVFAPDGTMYVTDLEQALIWRVLKGGGPAEVWFTDSRLENLFGPNGIQFMADGRTLLFAQTASSPPVTTDNNEGILYKLPVLPDGRPGQLEALWRSRPFDGPDGFAIARSGNVYVALAGGNAVAVVSPTGEDIARIPPTPLQNAAFEVPFDGPASVAFEGRRVLVTNQAFATGNPSSWAVIDVFAGETELPLHYPFIGRVPRPRLTLRLDDPRGRVARRARCAAGRVRATVGGADLAKVARATFSLRGGRKRRDARAPFSRVVHRPHGYPHSHKVRARVKLSDGRRASLARRFRAC